MLDEHDNLDVAVSLASVLVSGRAAHEARMVDTFEISVPTGGWVFDEATGEDVEALDLLFCTRGYFAAKAAQVSSSEVGGRTSLAERMVLRIPWDSPEVPPNAVAVCVAVGPSTPLRQLGRRVRVSGAAGDASQRTHYPLDVLEVLS